MVEGNRIKEVGVKGKIAIPPHAKIINATGKFILPGFIDAQAQGVWDIQPQFWLHFGITSVFFGGDAYMQKERDMQEAGTLTCSAHIPCDRIG